MQVYDLDHAATTALEPAVLNAMQPYFTQYYGNPSALYSLSDKTREAVWHAREQIAGCIGAKPEEIYFTAGGSEADNWAWKGVYYQWKKEHRRTSEIPHFITTQIEHHAIIHTAAFLEEQGAKVTCLPVDELGHIDLSELENEIYDHTVLVSVMAANNEIGTLSPLTAIGKICRKHQVLFHTDAVQAFGQIPIAVDRMHLDMMSASAHKLGGPKGCGFLYIRNGTRIENLIHGGGQEQEKRAGTENVAGIVGLGEAARLAHENMEQRFRRCVRARDYMMNRIMHEIPFCRVNGDMRNRLCGNLNMTFQFVNGNSLLGMLDDAGIYASAGSACNASSHKISHVLEAIHLPRELAEGTLRFTIPYDLTRADVDEIVNRLKKIVALARENNEEYQHLFRK